MNIFGCIKKVTDSTDEFVSIIRTLLLLLKKIIRYLLCSRKEKEDLVKGKEKPVKGKDAMENKGSSRTTSRRSRGAAPDFIIKPRSRSVLEGSNARFTCTVTGDPEPMMEWYFDGERFQPDERRELKLRNGIATIAIVNTCAEDIGDYKVVAKNELGEIEHTASLAIEGLTKPDKKKEKVPEESRY